VQKSTVGGILSIVAGALGAVGGLILLMVALLASTILSDPMFYNDSTLSSDQIATIVAVFYGVIAGFLLIVGVLGVVGGIFSLQRKRWGWALAGAIAGCFSFLPLGVGAVVLVAMGKSEFNRSTTNIASQPSGNTLA
jgi:hypothetical protein